MTATYQPDLVTVSWNGLIITGFAPDTFVTATRNNDSWNLTVGSGGESTRAKSGDKSGRVEVTLLAASISNAALSAQVAIDEATGAAVGPLGIKDLSGADAVVAGKAWIVKPADQEKANTESNRVWIFEAGELEIVNGGIVTAA